MCLNVQSAKNAWKILEDSDPSHIPISTLQEIRMTDKEIDAFRKSAFQHGYFLYCSPGKDSTGRWNSPIRL